MQVKVKKIPGLPPPRRRLCTKDFLFPAEDILDDSYISTAVIPTPNGCRAGFSIHDGKSSVVFQMDLVGPPAAPEHIEQSLIRLDRLINAVVGKLQALKANAVKGLSYKPSRCSNRE